MKIQYIAVIFVIIMIPITIVTSLYISSQIETINLQTQYNNKLYSATYSALTSFQINTVNNRYSSVSDSKIRDVEASVNTFFNTLIDSENLTKEEIQTFVPALVYTLYDGYYICSRYDNVMPNQLTTENTSVILSEDDLKKQEATYGLKPYIYYSCRYVNGNYDFVVNYTLDNAISVYGKINGEYKTLSGYFINYNKVKNINWKDNPLKCSLIYDEVLIEPEILTEHLLFADNTKGDYDYLEYNGQKIYYDQNSEKKYFYYNDYSKTYIVDKELKSYLEKRTSNNHLYSTSAFDYYYNAYYFSKNIQTLIGNITQNDAKDASGNSIVDFSTNTGKAPIFEVGKDNDPMLEDSIFNENRIAVIRKSIETNLSAAIANYSVYSDETTYEFSMPQLNEEDWGNITKNVSIITFMQGLPIGHKYYNNYCVITNNDNEEVVKNENIYIITKDSKGDREYHLAGCKHLMSNSVSQQNIVGAYANTSFIRQTVRISEGNYQWFYPQNIQVAGDNATKYLTSCYYCIVNATDVYDVNQILKGEIYRKKQ